ncbi:TetR/AcrR family transcriptional regulator [Planotetraspora phitsanulokensis]|uniref:TetR family transcriptional regulator n=1 Tax=Planotetraspora phitsanulokensis TaxID=575192 RepID=A0A8J3XH04_9ACTN|nr:TetR/AcrR family transcriptional regulator [Planotetraspora phitsanulokensis]GII36048.1 TetR family transcriptional regulator [Planotetraspora phitsanulokensis]
MPMGRPREFDAEQVVESALRVFWAKGYEGTTMADLSAATKLKAGSIYGAFGSKAGLFKQVVDRYARTTFAYGEAALAADTAREVARRWLIGAAEATTGPATPPGCLLVQGALATGDTADEVRADLCARRQAAEVLLTERFTRARDEGDLRQSVEPRDAAAYVLTLSQGFAVQAASGTGQADLRRLADLALLHLPWE